MRTYSAHIISGHVYALLLLSLSCLLFLASCGQSPSPATGTSTTPNSSPTALDTYEKPIVFPKTAPQRMISLVPSISEILGALHLQSKVVGVDYYTNYPADMAKRPKVSDASGKFNIEQIVALKPDLVLSDGALTKPYDANLARLGLNVVDLPAANVTQSLQQIALVGRLTFTQDNAKVLETQLQQQIDQVKAMVAGTTTSRVLLEVDDTTAGKPFVFGGGSFGDELLQDAHASNIFHTNNSNSGYPQVTDEAVITANPQFVILTEDLAYGGNPSTVYKRSNWGGIDAIKTHHVYHLNSDIMQRPGPRLVEGLRCLAQVVHPEKFSDALPDYCSAAV